MFISKIDQLQGPVDNESHEEKQSIPALRLNVCVRRSRCARVSECVRLVAHPDICVECFQGVTHLGGSVRECEFAQGSWSPQVRKSRG